MSKNRVVITGLGVVSPIGNSLQSYWDSLIQSKSGISYIEGFDTSAFSTRIGGQIRNFDAEQYLDKKEARRTTRFIIYAVAAATQAVKDSGLLIEPIAEEVGVEIGSGIGGIEILEEMTIALHEKGPSKISPFTVPMMIPDMASGLVSIKLGAKGPNSCTVTACASSTNSIGNAYKTIQRGEAIAMITGGAECAITPLGLGSFCAARSLTSQNDEPLKASRPFDNNRDGFVMGDGAGILVLEEYEHAKKRGAKIYAEVVGFGCAGDAYHITAPAPEGEGASRAIKKALLDAQLSINEIDYINAHGTSTKLNDKNETAAIKTVFGDHAKNLLISSTKSMTGHLLGAAGAIELIACAKAIETSIIPPTINQESPDPDCDLNYIPNHAINHTVNVAMSNSFGFGGHNAVLIIKKV